MPQQGYWIVCEDVYAGDQGSIKEPILCMGRVYGFGDAAAMASSRLEVLAILSSKLKDNINFLLDCSNDVPPPSVSDNPPPRLRNSDNTTCLFIPLEEIGVAPDTLLPSAA